MALILNNIVPDLSGLPISFLVREGTIEAVVATIEAVVATIEAVVATIANGVLSLKLIELCRGARLCALIF